MSANDTQVGGTHYRTQADYQHWDFMFDMYGSAWFIGNATKYVLRHRAKDGAPALEKALHYLHKLRELLGALEAQDGADAALYELTGVRADPLAALQKLWAAYAPQAEDAQALCIIMEVTVGVMPWRHSINAAIGAVEALLAQYTPAQDPTTPAPQPAESLHVPPPLVGYNVLTGAQVNLMNDIATHGNATGDLLLRVAESLQAEHEADDEAFNAGVHAAMAQHGEDALPAREAAIQALQATVLENRAARQEAMRWLSIAKTELQKGYMAAKRAVAKPKGF